MARMIRFVTHQERELELNGLKAPDELQINTVSQHPTVTNAHRPKTTCHHCKKKPGYYRNLCRSWKKQREQTEITQKLLETKTVAPITITTTATSTKLTKTTTTQTVTEPRGSRKLLTRPVRLVEKQTTLHKNVTLEPMQPIDPVPVTEDGKDRIRFKTEPVKVTQMKFFKLRPKI